MPLATIYVLPKLRSTETSEKKYEDEPIFIEVFERKNGEQEAENWKDNFEVTQTHEIVPNNA
ncbi:MAG: hypothetical protein P8O78_02730 [Flavobacteriaceae bacterium]|nr:hypothetical protein [Flavobacteriaceae bacterium]